MVPELIKPICQTKILVHQKVSHLLSLFLIHLEGIIISTVFRVLEGTSPFVLLSNKVCDQRP